MHVFFFPFSVSPVNKVYYWFEIRRPTLDRNAVFVCVHIVYYCCTTTTQGHTAYNHFVIFESLPAPVLMLLLVAEPILFPVTVATSVFIMEKTF